MADVPTPPPYAPRSYRQLCPLAMALDHVGDRWSMLIVRELLGGPARFSELARGLPGIASNLLTERLRRLEASGVIVRKANGGGALYALTALGQDLRAPLEALGAWGMRAGPVDGSRPEPLRTARSTAMGLEAMLGAGDPPAERSAIELLVDGQPLRIEIGGGAPPVVRVGTPDRARAVMSTTVDELIDLPAALARGAIRHVAGEPHVADALLTCLASGSGRLAG